MARQLVRKLKKTGQLYIRPKVVEAKIDHTLADGFTEAIRRAHIRDKTSSDFIISECLVHLIREAKRTGKDRESETLLQLLLERCEANLKGTIRNDGIPNPEELRDDILQNLAMEFALDAVEGGGRLDYFECRFNSAFAALRIDFYNREAALSNKTVAEISDTGDDLLSDEHENDIADSRFLAFFKHGEPSLCQTGGNLRRDATTGRTPSHRLVQGVELDARGCGAATWGER